MLVRVGGAVLVAVGAVVGVSVGVAVPPAANGAPAQVSPWHMSGPVHSFPSSQLTVPCTAVLTQPVAGLHESLVHGLPSSQVLATF